MSRRKSKTRITIGTGEAEREVDGVATGKAKVLADYGDTATVDVNGNDLTGDVIEHKRKRYVIVKEVRGHIHRQEVEIAHRI